MDEAGVETDESKEILNLAQGISVDPTKALLAMTVRCLEHIAQDMSAISAELAALRDTMERLNGEEPDG